MDYTTITKLFKHVLTRELPIEVLDELEHLEDKGTLSDPTSPGLSWKFIQTIDSAMKRTSKLFGVRLGDEQFLSPTEEGSILTALLLQTYPDFNRSSLQSALSPRPFIVGSEDNPLPFVGGSRQGELDGPSYDDIEGAFGPPSYAEGSGDGKVQLEWDIKFDNGVRASIYDYKQYDKDPYNDVFYWSVGGNSPESAFEVYKMMGLV